MKFKALFTLLSLSVTSTVFGQFDSTWVTCFTNVYKPKLSISGNKIDTCAKSVDVKVTYSGKPYYIYWNDGYSAADRTFYYSGQYQLYLLDSAGCLDTSVSLTVQLGDQYISAYAENGLTTIDICQGNTATLYAYSNSEVIWNTGEKQSTIYVNKAGKYWAKSTSSSKCQAVSDTVYVNVVNNNPVTIKYTGDTSICFGDSVLLESNHTDSNAYWYPYYKQGNKIYAKDPGEYFVYSKDEKVGCFVKSNSVNILVKMPKQINLCMVTVDSASGKNKLVWQSVNWATLYKIYRESSVAGEFELIGDLNGAGNDFFLDTTSKPRTRPYTYYIDAIDSCGNVAQENRWYQHTTLHLTANLGVSGENNLNWSDYFGIYPINTYNIFRSNNNGTFTKIASVSATVKSYSDFEPPKGSNRYYIGIDGFNACNSTTNNIINSNMVAFGILSNQNVKIQNLGLQPNPTLGLFTLTGEFGLGVEFQVLDIQGRAVAQFTCNESNTYDVSFLPAGLYYVHFENGQSLKLMKN